MSAALDVSKTNRQKYIFRNFQSPGDVVMLTAALRDLHLSFPGKFLTDVRTSCPALWEGNPWLTPIEDSDPSAQTIDCHYPLIHESNHLPYHFIHGFLEFLGNEMGVRIRPTEFKGDIYITERERSWMSQIMEITGEDTPFWIVNAGGKWDYTLKWWDRARYQEVVDHFAGRILFVQVGEKGHYHPELKGVIDLRGKTDLREFVRLVYHAQGVLCGVTAAMHLAAAVPVKNNTPKNRACVVVAGGREPMQWEAYPHHQYLHANGALLCCDQGGCWKARVAPIGDGDPKDDSLCLSPVQLRRGNQPPRQPDENNPFGSGEISLLPKCMDIIKPADVIRMIERYYSGGALRYLTPHERQIVEGALSNCKNNHVSCSI